MTDLRTPRSPRVLQDFDALARSGRQDYVQGLPTTLKGPARIWFSKLTPNSISTFKALTPSLPHTLSEDKGIRSLMNIKQRENEALRSYITSFNKEALLIDEANDKILVVAFTNRSRNGKFLFFLYKNDPKTMSDVLYRATKYMNAEDALLAREEKPKKREDRRNHDRTGGKR